MKEGASDDQPAREGPPARAEVGGPLDALNDGFHEAYAEARHGEKQRGPVFVVIADELVVFRKGKRTALSFAPRAYHVIKSVTHAPVALYAALARRNEEHTEAVLARVDALRRQADAALSEHTFDDLSGETREALQHVLRATAEFIARPLSPVTKRELDAFAAALGPVLLRLARAATDLQLEALHAHTEHALSLLSAAERAELEVVVAGDHQARARSLAMQYFRKRFDEPPDAERRVSYAEGVCDEHAAFELIGTRRLDRVLASAFFGDARRLQRDVLGDAARDLLESRAFEVVIGDVDT